MPETQELIPRVFISTTSSDLRSVRQAIAEGALKLGWFPEVQEYFETDYRTLRESILQKIQRCSAVIHVAGFRYGAEPRERPSNARRRSYTQMEYDIAKELEKKVYVFVCDKDFPFDPPRDTDKEESDEKQALQDEHRQELCARDRRYHRVNTKEDIEIKIREIRQQLDELYAQFKIEAKRSERERREFAKRLRVSSPTYWLRIVILSILGVAAATVSTPWSADFMRPALLLGAAGLATLLLSMLGFWSWFWFLLSALAFVASTVIGTIAPFRAKEWTYVAAVPTGWDWQSWQCVDVETPVAGDAISTLVVRDPIRVFLAARLTESLRLSSILLKSISINGRHYLQLPIRHAITASFVDKDGMSRWRSLYIPLLREGMNLEYKLGWDTNVFTSPLASVLDVTWPEGRNVVPWWCVEIKGDAAEQTHCVKYASLVDAALDRLAFGEVETGMQILSACGEPDEENPILVQPPSQMEKARIALINAGVSEFLWYGTVGHTHKIPFLLDAFQSVRAAMSENGERTGEIALLYWAFSRMQRQFDDFGDSFAEERKQSGQWLRESGLTVKKWVPPGDLAPFSKDSASVFEHYSQKLREAGRRTPSSQTEFPVDISFCRLLDDLWETRTSMQIAEQVLHGGDESEMRYLPMFLMTRFNYRAGSMDKQACLETANEDKSIFERLEAAKPELFSKAGWTWINEERDFLNFIITQRFEEDSDVADEYVHHMPWYPPFVREEKQFPEDAKFQDVVADRHLDFASPWWTRAYRDNFAVLGNGWAGYAVEGDNPDSPWTRLVAALKRGASDRTSFLKMTRDRNGAGIVCLPTVILLEAMAKGRGFASAKDFDALCVDTTRPKTSDENAYLDPKEGGHAVKWRDMEQDEISEEDTPNRMAGTIYFGRRMQTRLFLHYPPASKVPLHIRWADADLPVSLLGDIEIHAISVMQESIAGKERADVDADDLARTGEEDIGTQAAGRGFLAVQQVKLQPEESGQKENGITFDATLRSGPRYSIDQVKFQGLSKSEASILAGIITLKHGDLWDTIHLRRLRKEVEKYYEERGYLNATVDLEWKETLGSNAATAIVTIDAGKPFRIAKIEFDGPPVAGRDFPSIFSRSELMALTPLREGDPCDRDKIIAFKEAMLKLHRLNARVTCKIEIELVDTANPQQKVMRVEISDADQITGKRRSISDDPKHP